MMGNHAKALASFQSSEAILRVALPAGHPDLASVRQKVGCAQRALA